MSKSPRNVKKNSRRTRKKHASSRSKKRRQIEEEEDEEQEQRKEKTLPFFKKGHAKNKSVTGMLPFEDEWLYTVGMDETVRRWNIETGECHATFTLNHGAEVLRITKMAVPDEDGDEIEHLCLFIGSLDCSVKAWSIDSGEFVKSYRNHESAVLCLEFTEHSFMKKHGIDMEVFDNMLDEHFNLEHIKSHLEEDNPLTFYTSSLDHNIIEWDAKHGWLRKFEHQGVVTNVVIIDDRMFSSCHDGAVREWNLGDGHCCMEWQLSMEKWVINIEFYKGMIYASVQNCIYQIDSNNPDENSFKDLAKQYYSLIEKNEILDMCLVGNYLYVSASDRRIKEWDLERFDEGFIRSFQAHKGGVLCLAPSSDGSKLFSGDHNGVAMLWSLAPEATAPLTVARGESLPKGQKPSEDPTKVFRSVTLVEVILPLTQIASHTFKIWGFAFGPVFRMPLAFAPLKIVIPFLNLTLAMTSDLARIQSMIFISSSIVFIFLIVGGFYHRMENYIQERMRLGKPVRASVFHVQNAIFFYCYIMATSALMPAANSLFDSVACTRIDANETYWYESNLYEGARCFEGDHQIIAPFEVITFLVYFPFAVRLAFVAGNLSKLPDKPNLPVWKRIKHLFRHWISSQEKKNALGAGVFTIVSSTKYGFFVIVNIACLSIATMTMKIFRETAPLLCVIVFLLVSIALCTHTVYSPIYKEAPLNAVIFAARSMVAFTYVVCFPVFFIDNEETNWPAIVWFVCVIPVIFAAYKLYKRLRRGSICNRHKATIHPVEVKQEEQAETGPTIVVDASAAILNATTSADIQLPRVGAEAVRDNHLPPIERPKRTDSEEDSPEGNNVSAGAGAGSAGSAGSAGGAGGAGGAEFVAGERVFPAMKSEGGFANSVFRINAHTITSRAGTTARWRKKLKTIVTSTMFDVFILILIIINLVFLLRSDPGEVGYTLVEIVFTFFFVLEAVLKLIALGVWTVAGAGYFQDMWNVLDFTILLLFPITQSTSVRALRLVRPLRLTRRYKSMAKIFDSFALCFRRTQTAIVIFFVFIFLFAVFGLSAFQNSTTARCIVNDTFSFPSDWDGVVYEQTLPSRTCLMGNNYNLGYKCPAPSHCLPAKNEIAQSFDTVDNALLTTLLASPLESLAILMASLNDTETFFSYFFNLAFVNIVGFFALKILVAFFVVSFLDSDKTKQLKRMDDAVLQMHTDEKNWRDMQKEIHTRKVKTMRKETKKDLRKYERLKPKDPPKPTDTGTAYFTGIQKKLAAGVTKQVGKLASSTPRDEGNPDNIRQRQLKAASLVSWDDRNALSVYDKQAKELRLWKLQQEKRIEEQVRKFIKDTDRKHHDRIMREKYRGNNRCCSCMGYVLDSKVYNAVMTTLVILNLASEGYDHYGISETEMRDLYLFNVFLSIVYFVDILLLIVVSGPRWYFESHARTFDLLVVVGYAILNFYSEGKNQGLGYLGALRVFRIVRALLDLLKVEAFMKIIHVLRTGLKFLIPTVGLYSWFAFIFSIMGYFFFYDSVLRFPDGSFLGVGGFERWSFADLQKSLITMSHVAIGDGWINIARAEGSATAFAFFSCVYVVGSLCLGSIILSSLLVALIEVKPENRSLNVDKTSDLLLKNRLENGHSAEEEKEAINTMILANDQRNRERLWQYFLARYEDEQFGRENKVYARSELFENLPGYAKVQYNARRCLDNFFVATFSVLAIIASCIFLALDSDTLPAEVMFIINLSFGIYFSIEIIVDIVASGPAYFKSFLNIIDVVAVAGSLLSLGIPGVGLLRALRAFRPLRLLARLTEVKIIALCLASMVRPMSWILIFFTFCYFIYGLVGVSTFQGSFMSCNDGRIVHKDDCVGTFKASLPNFQQEWEIDRIWMPALFNFNHIGNSMLILFTVGSNKSWNDIMYMAMHQTSSPETGPSAWVNMSSCMYFILFAYTFGLLGFPFCSAIVVHLYLLYSRVFDGTYFLDKHAKFILVQKEACIQKCYEMVIELSMSHETRNIMDKFERVIAIVIVVNVLLPFTHIFLSEDAFASAAELLGYISLFIFGFELFFKVTVSGVKLYFKATRNRVDFIVTVMFVIITVVQLALDFFVPIPILSIRIGVVVGRFRNVRCCKNVQAAYHMVMTAAIHLWSVTLITAIFIFSFAVIGNALFEDISYTEGSIMDVQNQFWYTTSYGPHANFHTVFSGISTLYRVVTLDNWSHILLGMLMKDPYCDADAGGCGTSSVTVIFFVIIIVCLNLVLINLYIAELIRQVNSTGTSSKLQRYTDEVENFENEWQAQEVEPGFVFSGRVWALLAKNAPPFGFNLAKKFDYREEDEVVEVRIKSKNVAAERLLQIMDWFKKFFSDKKVLTEAEREQMDIWKNRTGWQKLRSVPALPLFDYFDYNVFRCEEESDLFSDNADDCMTPMHRYTINYQISLIMLTEKSLGEDVKEAARAQNNHIKRVKENSAEHQAKGQIVFKNKTDETKCIVWRTKVDNMNAKCPKHKDNVVTRVCSSKLRKCAKCEKLIGKGNLYRGCPECAEGWCVDCMSEMSDLKCSRHNKWWKHKRAEHAMLCGKCNRRIPLARNYMGCPEPDCSMGMCKQCVIESRRWGTSNNTFNMEKATECPWGHTMIEWENFTEEVQQQKNWYYCEVCHCELDPELFKDKIFSCTCNYAVCQFCKMSTLREVAFLPNYREWVAAKAVTACYLNFKLKRERQTLEELKQMSGRSSMKQSSDRPLQLPNQVPVLQPEPSTLSNNNLVDDFLEEQKEVIRTGEEGLLVIKRARAS